MDGPENIELRTLRKSNLELELEAIEGEPSSEDRQAYLVDFFHNLVVLENEKVLRGERGMEEVKYRYWNSNKDGQSYVQSGVPYNNSEIGLTKPIQGEDSDTRVISSGDHRLVKVGQCKMICEERRNGHYAYMTMSSCTALIGVQEGQLWIAHVGLSESDGTRGFLNKMKDHGVALEKVYAVVSLGSKYSSEDLGVKNEAINLDHTHPTDLSFYTGLGIRDDNIMTFDHYTERVQMRGKYYPEDRVQRILHKEMVTLVIDAGGLTVFTFDQEVEPTKQIEVIAGKPYSVRTLSF